MRCCHVQRWASAYLDGELDSARAGALRGHLRTCEPCRQYLDELGALIDAAASAELPEPPASLWSAIEQGLAEAEVADARRPWFWLQWQAARPRLLPAAVVLAALALTLVWLERRVYSPWRLPAPMVASAAPETQPGAAEPAPPNDSAMAATATFAELRARQVLAADQRYLTTIDELIAIVDEERETWPAADRAAFDTHVREFRSEAQRHALALAVREEPEPRNRDALYAVYRAEIAFLQDAALYWPINGSDRLASGSPR
jgi:anti-sigma factor RsiW